MKIDPKIVMGIGIGFILSSLLFIVAQPFQTADDSLQMDQALKQKNKEDDLTGLLNDTANKQNDGIEKQILENEQNEQNEPQKDFKDQVNATKEYTIVEISEGLAADEIALLLEKHGIIDESAELIDILVENEKVTNLNYGKFQFPQDVEPEYVAERLISGP